MQGKGYNYDQLHRLTGMTVYENEAFVSSEWKWSSGGALSDYATTISYDPAGNIDSLSRNGFAGVQTTMDQMAYHYVSGTNRLDYVNDHVNASTYADDIESGMSANNYTYDDLGRLISDNQENITSILWNAMNKVKFVDRSGSYDDTYYEYDAFGRRVMRCAISTSGDSTFTYYVYDAGGTPLAIYGREYDDMGATDFEDKIYLEDNPIYGSARHGSNKRNLLLADTSYITSTGTGNVYTVDTIARLAGLRYYELKGHTGNVYVVISDRKEAQDNNTDGTVDEYEPDILARNDYYAFGMVMPGRSENPTLYRYAFDGLEGDHSVAGNNLSYTTYFRQYDPRLGRWKSPDPVIHPWESAYAGFADNPILYIDPMGNAAGAAKSVGDVVKAVGEAIATVAKKVADSKIGQFFFKKVPNYLPRVPSEGAKKYKYVLRSDILDRLLRPIKKLLSPKNVEKVARAGSGLNASIEFSKPIVMRMWVSDNEAQTNEGFWNGFGDGVGAGANSTLEFFKSLGTKQGWIDVGNGILSMSTFSCVTCPDGVIMRSQMAMSAHNYIENIPNMSSYEIGYDLGYGTEKLAETLILTKGANFVATGIRFRSIGAAAFHDPHIGYRSYLFGRKRLSGKPKSGLLNTGHRRYGWSWYGDKKQHVFQFRIGDNHVPNTILFRYKQ